MPPFVPVRLAEHLQHRTETYTYTDTAVYITPADPNTTDAYGQPSGSETETVIACSFTDSPSTERWRGDVDIEMLAGEIRFTDITPTKGGQVRITKRFGQAVTPKTYEIIGIQDRGAFGFVCALKATRF